MHHFLKSDTIRSSRIDYPGADPERAVAGALQYGKEYSSLGYMPPAPVECVILHQVQKMWADHTTNITRILNIG
jgi:hypothetical protein